MTTVASDLATRPSVRVHAATIPRIDRQGTIMNSGSNTPRSLVNRGALTRQKVGDRVNTLDAVCAAGAGCPAVTASPLASAALDGVKAAAVAARAAMVSRNALLVSYRAQCKIANTAIATLDKAASAYMTAVDDIAVGDAAIITSAGLPARTEQPAVTTPSLPLRLRSAPGKQSRDATVQWDPAPGASAYKLRVNFTPGDPTKWEERSAGASRRRTVTAPTPAAQFLVAVASIGADATTEWSDPIMATAR